jgi:predicted nucleic acid-binding protein
MLRVIFDTNIYGLLLTEKDADKLERKIVQDKEFVVYSYKPIRQEIRDIPKVSKLSKKTRHLLLSLYDRITENHFLEHSIKITNLARKYYDYYRNQGGIYGWDTSVRIDFMIVACASFNGLDIVYSEDNKTLMSKSALKAYRHINLKENLRTPNFLNYKDLLFKLRTLV